MRDSNTERIGIYKSGFIFTKEIKWIFREQPIVDIGIDALIEQSINGNPTGQFIASQIKTGEGNFHISENHLTHYVSKIHYNYWLNFNFPVILIGHLPENDKTYWENITKKNLQKTKKHWKIIISKKKELGVNSIDELTSIIEGSEPNNFLKDIENGLVTDLELQKIIEESESSTFFREATSNIVMLITHLGEKTTENNNLIDDFGKQGLTKLDKRVLKNIKKYAEFMNSITLKLNKEIDDFAYHYARAIYAYEKATLMNFHITKNYKKLNDTSDSLKPLIPAIESAINGLKIMRNSVSNLPNKYSHLKKAKISFIDTTNQIINEFNIAVTATKKLIENISRISG